MKIKLVIPSGNDYGNIDTARYQVFQKIRKEQLKFSVGSFIYYAYFQIGQHALYENEFEI